MSSASIGVAKPAVGLQVYRKAVRSRLPAAYIDLDEVRFCCRRSMTSATMRWTLATSRRCGRSIARPGPQCLVVGPVEDDEALDRYAEATPAATVIWLQAGPDQLRRRILLRGRGAGWLQPGDP
jgi:hypothetical protein